MTRNEALTKVLEEGRKSFENGGGFTVNGLLLANYFNTAKLEFDYDAHTKTIDALFLKCEGNTVVCVCADAIKYVNVSVKNAFLTSDTNYCYGRIKGKEFNTKGGE